MQPFPLKKLIVWATPASALSALGLPLAMFLPNYYIENVGLSATATGLVFLLLRLWDGITDPLLGMISDRLSPPIGRRRFWVVIALPILLLSSWMVLVPPSNVGPIYLAGWLMLLYVGITAMQVGHISWGAELVSSYDERSRLMGWYELFVIAGLLALLGLAAVLEFGTPSDFVQSQRGDTLRAMAIFLLILFPITVIPAVLLIPEGRKTKQNSFNLREGLMAIALNNGLRNVLSVNLLYRAATGISATLFLWYVSLRLELGGLAAMLMAVYFLSALLAMPFWMKMTKAMGKKKTYEVSLLVAACVTLPLMFLNASSPVFGSADTILLKITDVTLNIDQVLGMALVSLIGILYGVAPFLARAMMADVADEELLNTRVDRTGLFYALLSFSEKLGFAIAVGVSVSMLGLIGLETGLDAKPTTEAIHRLAWIYGLGPITLYVTAYLVVKRFHISKSSQENTQQALKDQNLVKYS